MHVSYRHYKRLLIVLTSIKFLRPCCMSNIITYFLQTIIMYFLLILKTDFNLNNRYMSVLSNDDFYMFVCKPMFTYHAVMVVQRILNRSNFSTHASKCTHI